MAETQYRMYQNVRERQEAEEDDFAELEKKAGTPEPEISKEEAVWKDRYGNLRRHSAEKEASYKAEIEQLRRQASMIQQGQIKPPKSAAEIIEWKETYPDFADVLDTWIKDEVTKATKDLRSTTNEIKKEKAILALEKKHPDANKIFADPEFHDWLQQQSQAEQNYIYKSYDVGNASFVLDKYKAQAKNSRGPGRPRKEDEDDARAAAKAVKTKTSRVFDEDAGGEWEFSESGIEKACAANPKWWDANEDKVMDAQRRGKILLDLSGGAR